MSIRTLRTADEIMGEPAIRLASKWFPTIVVVESRGVIRLLRGDQEIGRAYQWEHVLDAVNDFVGQGYWIEGPA